MTQSPLLPTAFAFALGIALAPNIYISAHHQLGTLVVCTAFAVLLAIFRRTLPALVLSWIGFTLCGALLAAFERLPVHPNQIDEAASRREFDPKQSLKVLGWASTASQSRPGSYVFDIAVERIEQSESDIPATGTIRVYYYPKTPSEAPFELPYGSRVSLNLRDLRAPRNYANRGLYDYEVAMRRQGISYTGLLRNRDADLHILPGISGNRLQAAVAVAREEMLASIERMLTEKLQEQGILKAMLLGDDSWLRESTEDVFQRSGTYHVLVISGWNVAVFAGPLLFLLGWLRLSNWLTSLIVFASVTWFALIAQAEIPIVRASTMFVVYLVARFFFRRRVLLNSLAAAALLLLIYHPADLFDGGFQLSFLAVLTLASVALPAIEWTISPYRHALGELFDQARDLRFSALQIQFRSDLRTIFNSIVRSNCSDARRDEVLLRGLRLAAWCILSIAEALMFTLVMQMGYALVSAQYFHRLTWSGILGNLLVLPIASCLVLFGMVLIPGEIMVHSLGKLVGPILGTLSSALEAIAKLSANMESLNLRIATPPIWLSICFLISVISLAVLIQRRSKWSSMPAGSLLLLCFGLSLLPSRSDCPSGRLEVTALDVGQGDALLICFPQGRTMLVDAGGSIPIPGSPVRRQDIGETVVSPYLWDRGITRLDYVVLSHDHFDHMGGLEAVFENFRVGEFWMGPDAASRKMDWLRGRAAKAGARIVWPVRHSKPHPVQEIDGVRVEILSPPEDWNPRTVGNDDSIVLKLTYGKRTILLAGDIESRMEQILAASELDFRSDVLKVAHHGSRSSTTREFFSRVDPTISMVSVGAYGRFGHPSAQVIERLSANGRQVYLTPDEGAITIRTDGHRIQVDTYRSSLRWWPEFEP